ncbi:Phosphoserine phosphatase RsbP [Microbulbifer aggregans]|uniref:Phosphoserine phosphatase RsbP n=1 Tax=Microbulbifer aggregans TaxID=1769779 RepID=A0A1C9W8X0_9GAMM|nr:SpoIIE family protein phosphatase [Microbulbifer aggregans]AOS97606.1 Phosphoserine phosphatase RsbP [Microbulbifer aggregans]
MLRLLIVEPVESEASLLAGALRTAAEESSELATVAIAIERNMAAALSSFTTRKPSMVLIGPGAAAESEPGELDRLRALAGMEPVPTILAGDERDRLLERALAMGADEIMAKPYDPRDVRLKLETLGRLARFGSSLLAQRDHFRQSNDGFLQEQASVRRMFSNLSRESCLNGSRAIRHHLSPQALLNGDVVAAAWGPGGKLVMLLGDFTGHGLAAAIGTVPLTSVFYSMVPKGFSLVRILQELNGKLHRLLPGNMFCCAILLELDTHKRRLRLFNGGMPSACLRRGSGRVRQLESRQLPLGVLAEIDAASAIVHIPVEADDTLYLWSDGLSELRSAAGEVLGQRRIVEAVSRIEDEEERFDRILDEAFRFAARQADDLSLVELRFGAAFAEAAMRAPVCPRLPVRRVGEWSVKFTLGPQELRDADPLPPLLDVLAQTPGAAHFRDALTVVLGELFRNALEHGVIGLDSAMKASEVGFAEYYHELHRRRRDLRHGWIQVAVRCQGRGAGGVLEVVVDDSGSGFPANWSRRGNYAGRGLPLLRSFCRILEVQYGSSRVRAVLEWGPVDGDGRLRPGGSEFSLRVPG